MMQLVTFRAALSIVILSSVTSPASADLVPPFGWSPDPNLDKVLLFNDGESFTLTVGGQSQVEPWTGKEPFSTRKVVGISFAGVVTNVGVDSAISDLKLTVSYKGENDNDFAPVLKIGGQEPKQWAFADQKFFPSAYFHGYLADPNTGGPGGDGQPEFFTKPRPAAGEWKLTLDLDGAIGGNNATAEWKAVVITLHMIAPAPGAFALFAIAGFIGPRRRRGDRR